MTLATQVWIVAMLLHQCMHSLYLCLCLCPCLCPCLCLCLYLYLYLYLYLCWLYISLDLCIYLSIWSASIPNLSYLWVHYHYHGNGKKTGLQKQVWLCHCSAAVLRSVRPQERSGPRGQTKMCNPNGSLDTSIPECCFTAQRSGFGQANFR